jgi:hypothetical protein
MASAQRDPRATSSTSCTIVARNISRLRTPGDREWYELTKRLPIAPAGASELWFLASFSGQSQLVLLCSAWTPFLRARGVLAHPQLRSTFPRMRPSEACSTRYFCSKIFLLKLVELILTGHASMGYHSSQPKREELQASRSQIIARSSHIPPCTLTQNYLRFSHILQSERDHGLIWSLH